MSGPWPERRMRRLEGLVELLSRVQGLRRAEAPRVKDVAWRVLRHCRVSRGGLDGDEQPNVGAEPKRCATESRVGIPATGDTWPCRLEPWTSLQRRPLCSCINAEHA